uniref:Uncharacterized protein n=1 Tax=Tolypothrix bouteillei VB521301 TaxID=1479485 RepID=A0A0C1RCJ8_9CYAN
MVTPEPVWARQMDGGSGGGSLTSEGNGGTASADEGSFSAHINRANRDLGSGAAGGAVVGAMTGNPRNIVPGAVVGAVSRTVEGCTTCHDGSRPDRPDRPGTTSPVRLNRPSGIGSSGAGGNAN